MKEMFKQMLTGAGSRFNGGNRWFDKTVQVRSSPDLPFEDQEKLKLTRILLSWLFLLTGFAGSAMSTLPVRALPSSNWYR